MAALARKGHPRPTSSGPASPAPDPGDVGLGSSFEDVVQELGAFKAALRQGAATGVEVQRLLEAAEWLDRRGGELLGRDRPASQPAG